MRARAHPHVTNMYYGRASAGLSVDHARSWYLRTHVRVSRGVRAKQGDQQGRKACLEEGEVGCGLALEWTCFFQVRIPTLAEEIPQSRPASSVADTADQ